MRDFQETNYEFSLLAISKFIFPIIPPVHGSSWVEVQTFYNECVFDVFNVILSFSVKDHA